MGHLLPIQPGLPPRSGHRSLRLLWANMFSVNVLRDGKGPRQKSGHRAHNVNPWQAIGAVTLEQVRSMNVTCGVVGLGLWGSPLEAKFSEIASGKPVSSRRRTNPGNS